MSESGESVGGTNKGLQRIRDAFDKVKKLGPFDFDTLIDDDSDLRKVEPQVKQIIEELFAIKDFD